MLPTVNGDGQHHGRQHCRWSPTGLNQIERDCDEEHSWYWRAYQYRFQHGNKPDLRKVGKDIYEVLTGTGSYGYKKLARNQTIKIEPDKNYSPSEVAAILNVSYDAASRLMLKMKGVGDFGTPTRRYRRGKKKLRISGKNVSVLSSPLALAWW